LPPFGRVGEGAFWIGLPAAFFVLPARVVPVGALASGAAADGSRSLAAFLRPSALSADRPEDCTAALAFAVLVALGRVAPDSEAPGLALAPAEDFFFPALDVVFFLATTVCACAVE